MSLKKDPGIVDFISKKFLLAAKPTLVRLIERGNIDGSWNCEDADITAQFILQGMDGTVGQMHAQQGCDEEKLKRVITEIIFRILGVSNASTTSTTNATTTPNPKLKGNK